MKLEDLKRDFDRDYCSGQTIREMASDDLVFYWVTHWDDAMLNSSNLAYKGQFDVLRKAGRQIIGDLRSNEVSIDFHPIDESREDGADFIDGLYRTDDRRNSSIEAYDYSLQEAVVCGFGAWEVFTRYQSDRSGSEIQIIDRRYIPEAVNTIFWDANAKALDKSDAARCAILYAYTEDGYKALREELGLDEDTYPSSFNDPAQSYTFPWIAEMIFAQAKMLEGQAANKKADIDMFNAQQNAANNQIGSQVDIYKAQTERINSQVNAEKVGAEINYKRIDTIGKPADRMLKLRGSAA